VFSKEEEEEEEELVIEFSLMEKSSIFLKVHSLLDDYI
jgi:hypothetical protein